MRKCEHNNTKWRYDVSSGKFVNPETNALAPKKIQDLLKNKDFMNGIKKH